VGVCLVVFCGFFFLFFLSFVFFWFPPDPTPLSFFFFLFFWLVFIFFFFFFVFFFFFSSVFFFDFFCLFIVVLSFFILCLVFFLFVFCFTSPRSAAVFALLLRVGLLALGVVLGCAPRLAQAQDFCQLAKCRWASAGSTTTVAPPSSLLPRVLDLE